MSVLKRIPLFLALSLTVQSVVYTQEKKPKEQDKKTTTQSEAPSTTPPTPRPPLAFGLTEDTPVRLKLARTMSSHDAKVDEKVDFEVVEDVKIGDVVVIQHGGMAIATVTEAKSKARMGKAGKLNMNIDYVQLVSGEKVPLRAVKGGSGGNHTGAMTGAIVATSILFFPAAPFFLFMHGKDITIPKGTEITAYVAGDTPLDPSKFKSSTLVESVASKPDVSASNLSPIAVKSTPDGAEITIDGKLVGTTPSTVQVTPGDHTIVIGKAGFKSWQRTITVTTGGTINLEATLDKVP
ncbi:MAG TPA: PEGA domain-containing protein [Pyrinomonadaceae bacterium]|nr:PEGA domain-containing protein [Pyrinomonadaceae bacterium]